MAVGLAVAAAALMAGDHNPRNDYVIELGLALVIAGTLAEIIVRRRGSAASGGGTSSTTRAQE